MIIEGIQPNFQWHQIAVNLGLVVICNSSLQRRGTNISRALLCGLMINYQTSLITPLEALSLWNKNYMEIDKGPIRLSLVIINHTKFQIINWLVIQINRRLIKLRLSQVHLLQIWKVQKQDRVSRVPLWEKNKNQFLSLWMTYRCNQLNLLIKKIKFHKIILNSNHKKFKR